MRTNCWADEKSQENPVCQGGRHGKLSLTYTTMHILVPLHTALYWHPSLCDPVPRHIRETCLANVPLATQAPWWQLSRALRMLLPLSPVQKPMLHCVCLRSPGRDVTPDVCVLCCSKARDIQSERHSLLRWPLSNAVSLYFSYYSAKLYPEIRVCQSAHHGALTPACHNKMTLIDTTATSSYSMILHLLFSGTPRRKDWTMLK